MIIPVFKMLRPHQWMKNVFCLAGVVFGGQMGNPRAVLADLVVFAVFCAASSAVYVYNDLRDIARDRVHPRKRNRAIASGQVPVSLAIGVAVTLAVLSLLGAARVGPSTLTCVLMYVGINLAYTMGLKNTPLIDVNCIAAGFVLRMIAGVYAIDDVPTVWIVLCTFTLALFMALAKRRSELATLPPGEVLQRPVLQVYTVQFLDTLINSAATVTVVAYALFTTLSGKNPTLLLTVPIVFYAVMRYKMLLVLEGGAEEPEQIILHDRAIQISIVVWMAAYLAITVGQVHLFR